MAWVYRQGHKVVGIEVIAEAAHQLFEEAQLDYVVKAMPSISGWKYEVKVVVVMNE